MIDLLVIEHHLQSGKYFKLQSSLQDSIIIPASYLAYMQAAELGLKDYDKSHEGYQMHSGCL